MDFTARLTQSLISSQIVTPHNDPFWSPIYIRSCDEQSGVINPHHVQALVLDCSTYIPAGVYQVDKPWFVGVELFVFIHKCSHDYLAKCRAATKISTHDPCQPGRLFKTPPKNRFSYRGKVFCPHVDCECFLCVDVVQNATFLLDMI